MAQNTNNIDQQINSGEKFKEINLLPNKSQLIDLNENETNFELKFSCSCDNNEEFKLAIVTQDQLDAENFDIDNAFKSAKGTISGNFNNVDKVHYFGYYIGNYPDLSNLKIKKICKILNSFK